MPIPTPRLFIMGLMSGNTEPLFNFDTAVIYDDGVVAWITSGRVMLAPGVYARVTSVLPSKTGVFVGMLWLFISAVIVTFKDTEC